MSDGKEQEARDTDLVRAGKRESVVGVLVTLDFQERLWGYKATEVAQAAREIYMRNGSAKAVRWNLALADLILMINC